MYRIRVGGKKQCIYISLASYDEYAGLLTVKHDEDCVLSCLEDGTSSADVCLPRSSGTVKLVCVALSFVLSKYPFIKGFVFEDHSQLDCLQDVKLSLTDYYIAKHGKTWYHDKFGALPLLETHKQQYLRALDRYTSMPIGTTTPQAFYDTYVRPFESVIRIRGMHGKSARRSYLQFLLEYFEKHMPQHDTYSSLMRKMTGNKESNDCAMFQKWLPEFIRSLFPIALMEIDWVIDSKNVKEWKTKLSVAVSSVENADKASASGVYWGGETTKKQSKHRATPWMKT